MAVFASSPAGLLSSPGPAPDCPRWQPAAQVSAPIPPPGSTSRPAISWKPPVVALKRWIRWLSLSLTKTRLAAVAIPLTPSSSPSAVPSSPSLQPAAQVSKPVPPPGTTSLPHISSNCPSAENRWIRERSAV